MKKVRISENDLVRIVKLVLSEQMIEKPLKIGNKDVDKNGQIRKLQQKLMELGYLKTKSMIPTGYFGSLTKAALSKYQTDMKLRPTGEFDQQTRNSLPLDRNPVSVNKEPISPKSLNKNTQEKNKQLENSAICVGLPKESCSKVSSKNIVNHGDAGTHECAAYVTKCLSEYDREYYTGNAWKASAIAKGNGGKEKFNLFTSNIDWANIWNKLKSNKITKSDCERFAGKSKSDYFTFRDKSKAIIDIAATNIPEKSNVNLSQLRPGDIVGLWHKDTVNKGRAFCERMIDDLKLDDNGNFKENPFTYNTHVGFVTTIKNGVPIIAHNVSGTYYTVPATQMLSKNDNDMITWVISDPQVESQVAKKMSQINPLNYPFKG